MILPLERLGMTLFNGLSAAIAFFYAIGCWFTFRYYKNLDETSDRLAARWLTAGFFLQGITLAWKWGMDGFAPLTTMGGILSALSFSLAMTLLIGRLKTPVAV